MVLILSPPPPHPQRWPYSLEYSLQIYIQHCDSQELIKGKVSQTFHRAILTGGGD